MGWPCMLSGTGAPSSLHSVGATWSWDEHNEISGAFMYAFNNSVQGPSLFNNFIPGGSMQEQVQLKEYSIGVQYAHKF